MNSIKRTTLDRVLMSKLILIVCLIALGGCAALPPCTTWQCETDRMKAQYRHDKWKADWDMQQLENEQRQLRWKQESFQRQQTFDKMVRDACHWDYCR